MTVEELMFRPELKDPINAIGAIAACLGGLGLFGIFIGFPDWLVIASLILWACGIGILAYHSRKENK